MLEGVKVKTVPAVKNKRGKHGTQPGIDTTHSAVKENPSSKKQTTKITISFGNKDISFYNPLTFLQKFTAHSFLAIDIDTDKIRYVAGQKAGKVLSLQEHGALFLPEVDSDPLKSVKISLDNIQANVYKSGQKIHACIYSPDVTVRPVILPKMRKGKDLDNAIFFKIQAELTGFNEKSTWHYKIIDEFLKDDIKYYKVIVLVVPGDVISSYLGIFERSGLTPQTLTVRPIAINHAFNKLIDHDGADVLVDISYGLTHINFIRNGALEYTRTVTTGASNLEVAVRGKKGKILADESLVLNEEDGLSKEGALRPELLRKALAMRLNALETHQNPVLRLFKNELQNSLDYFNSLDKDVKVKRVFLTGYGIQKESLVSFLKNTLALPVFILTPKIEDSNFLSQGEYLTPIGASIESNDPFNLVPDTFRSNLLFKRLNYAAVLMAVFIAFGLYSYNHVLDLTINALYSQVQYRTQQYKVLNPIEAEYIKGQEEINKNDLEISKLKKQIHPGSPITDLMRLFSNETPDQIQLRTINLNRISPVQLKKHINSSGIPAKANKDNTFIVRVSGEVSGDYLMSDVILINYMDRLRNLGYFNNIEVSDKLKKNHEHKMLFEFKAIL